MGAEGEVEGVVEDDDAPNLLRNQDVAACQNHEERDAGSCGGGGGRGDEVTCRGALLMNILAPKGLFDEGAPVLNGLAQFPRQPHTPPHGIRMVTHEHLLHVVLPAAHLQRRTDEESFPLPHSDT